MDPHVSINFSTYNEGDYVARTVAAIFDWTDYPAFDIVVHDDGSDDGSCDRLPRDSRLTIVRSETRRGVDAGRMIASNACQGDVLLNMDCHVAPAEPTWLRRLIDVLDRCDRRAILSPMIHPLDAVSWQLKAGHNVVAQLKNTFHVDWGSAVDMSKHFHEVSAVRGGARLMTRRLYDAIGGFDDTLGYGGEADLSMRAWMSGFTCAFVPTSVIGHVFKRRSQFPRSYTDELVTRLSIAHKCLSVESYAKVVSNNHAYLTNAGPWGAGVIKRGTTALEQKRDQLQEARKAVLKRSSRPGEWVLERFAIPL